MKKSEASEVFHISRNTINRWVKRKADTGDYCAKSYKPPGHSHKITDWEKFRAFTVEHSDRTQAQMAQLWCGEISERTMSRALKKIGFTRKKTYGYQERNEGKRSQFLENLRSLKPEQIIYADEAGMDSRDRYAYGYSPPGVRLHALKSGGRRGRINMITAFCQGQLLAPFTLSGAGNRNVFELWLETCLIPTLKPGQKLVIDNATFHKGGRIEELVKDAGCNARHLRELEFVVEKYEPD